MDLVGPEHVGLGFDYVINKQEPIDCIENHLDGFPPDRNEHYLAFVEPEQLPKFTKLLLKLGHNEGIIQGVLGRFFLRIAKGVLKLIIITEAVPSGWLISIVP